MRNRRNRKQWPVICVSEGFICFRSDYKAYTFQTLEVCSPFFFSLSRFLFISRNKTLLLKIVHWNLVLLLPTETVQRFSVIFFSHYLLFIWFIYSLCQNATFDTSSVIPTKRYQGGYLRKRHLPYLRTFPLAEGSGLFLKTNSGLSCSIILINFDKNPYHVVKLWLNHPQVRPLPNFFFAWVQEFKRSSLTCLKKWTEERS